MPCVAGVAHLGRSLQASLRYHRPLWEFGSISPDPSDDALSIGSLANSLLIETREPSEAASLRDSSDIIVELEGRARRGRSLANLVVRGSGRWKTHVGHRTLRSSLALLTLSFELLHARPAALALGIGEEA